MGYIIAGAMAIMAMSSAVAQTTNHPPPANATNFNVTKDFRGILLERQNHFRALHGVLPLQINETLNKDAQTWAEAIAAKCNSSYSKQADRDKVMGGFTAEYLVPRLGRNQSNKPDPYNGGRIIAFDAINLHYAKIKDYPYPEYTGDYTDPLFAKIRPFSQIIWKDTHSVGFGYANNSKCSPGAVEYLVLRYFPGGNLRTKFKKNVPPVKKPLDPEEVKRVHLGVKWFQEIFYTICWYADAKVFPYSNHTDPKEEDKPVTVDNCYMRAKNVHQQNLTDAESLAALIDSVVREAQPEYHGKCAHLLENATAAPNVSESDALNDGGKEYHFRAYWYCMIHTIREMHGNESIEEIKSERTHGNKTWNVTMFERENRYRERHSVEPFTLDQRLVDGAQARADEMAKKCSLFRKINLGNLTNDVNANPGEHYCQSKTSDPAVAVLECLNHWYKEHEHYNFPEGFDELRNLKKPLPKISHFAQIVWSGSKLVGYGMAVNPDCAGNGSEAKPTMFIVSRYYPKGNIEWEYNAHVFPVKGSQDDIDFQEYMFYNNKWVGLGLKMFIQTFGIMCQYANGSSGTKDTPAFKECMKGPEDYLADRLNRTVMPTPAGFGDVLFNVSKAALPEYHEACTKYLFKPKANPQADENEALNDGERDYPFKGFFYCLINVLRERHGDALINEIKKSWKTQK